MNETFAERKVTMNETFAERKATFVLSYDEVRSATRSFALRARGFLWISSVLGRIGFLVSARYRESSRNASFTRRSSREWKLRIAIRPPCRRHSGILRSAISSDFNSSLTAMRRA